MTSSQNATLNHMKQNAKVAHVHWHKYGLAQKEPDLPDCNSLHLQQNESQLMCHKAFISWQRYGQSTVSQNCLKNKCFE